MTQLELIRAALSGGRQPGVSQLHDETGILRPNIRRILGVGTKQGQFECISEGVYALATSCGRVKAYVQQGASEQTLHELANAGIRFDSIILDPAYFSPALVGGNRGIKAYDFIKLPEFARMMQAVRQLVRTPTSHVYLMLSGAPSAQADMNAYLAAALACDLQVAGEGYYRKLYRNGQPVTNVRGEEAAAEWLLLLTVSGKACAGELAGLELEFEAVRPPVASSYATEKAVPFIDRLIRQSTVAGQWVLDAFAGSGVTGEQCLRHGRFSVLVERLQQTIEQYILPRLAMAAVPPLYQPGVQAVLF